MIYRYERNSASLRQRFYAGFVNRVAMATGINNVANGVDEVH